MNSSMNHLVRKITHENTYHLLNIQTELSKSIYDFFTAKKVNYILPVILSPETDKLQEDVLECNIEYYDQRLHLMKSMILQKQITLLNENIESIYTISPCIRLERRDKYTKGRHSIEFQQLDFEFKNQNYEYVINFVEELIVHIFSHIKINCKDDLNYFHRDIIVPETPFKRYDNKVCLKEIGPEYELKLSKQNESLFWVLNFDRWIYDKRIIVDNEKMNLNYDLIFPNGFCELGSGGEREIDKSIIKEKIQENGLDINNHHNYLEILDYNFSPSAGIGLGIQRFMRFFTGNYDINQTIPFSRPVEGNILL